MTWQEIQKNGVQRHTLVATAHGLLVEDGTILSTIQLLVAVIIQLTAVRTYHAEQHYIYRQEKYFPTYKLYKVQLKKTGLTNPSKSSTI